MSAPIFTPTRSSFTMRKMRLITTDDGCCAEISLLLLRGVRPVLTLPHLHFTLFHTAVTVSYTVFGNISLPFAYMI